MNMFQSFSAVLSDVISSPLGSVLIKSTLAIALAAIVCLLLRRQSAAVRHRVWVCGLAASLAIPAISLIAPQFRLDVLPESTSPSAAPLAESVATGAEFATAAPEGPAARNFVPRPATDSQTENGAHEPAQPAVSVSEQFTPPASSGPSRQSMLVWGWVLGMSMGAVLFVAAVTRQFMRLGRLCRVDDGEWVEMVAAAAKTLGIGRSIATLQSDEACVPAVVGVFHSRLVIPRDWRTWSTAQRQCIVLHELAHVKRRDVLAQLLGRLALLVYWFNPLFWYAVRQLRVERELASDDCVLQAGQTPSTYAEQLLKTLRAYRPARAAISVAMAHSARIDQRVLAILDPQRRRNPVGIKFALLLLCGLGLFSGLLGGVTLSTRPAVAEPPKEPETTVAAAAIGSYWKENYAVEYPGSLPVSVAFSADGETLLTGDTGGEVMALIFTRDEPRWRWKANVGGSHAAVAFSADQERVYATTKDGVRILDAFEGKEDARIEENSSSPTAIGVFPVKQIAFRPHTYHQIVFGNARGYYVKTWIPANRPDTAGTIRTSTVAEEAQPADNAAVPLAVDPNGRCAIMTGPIDATGKVAGVKGKNVLWAYVCGDYSEGSPGNRVMVGHVAPVVSAAWAKNGDTAVTGDADGRVIVWDAKTMKVTRRLELGGRVAALAISSDGKQTAAFVLGKQGRVFVWDTAAPPEMLKPIHTELGDFTGPETYASLSFSPDGKQLAGCAINKKWLDNPEGVKGKVRVWELAAEPKAQLPPNLWYSKQVPQGSSSNFVVLHNHSILMPAVKNGAVDFRSIATGDIQSRITMGEFKITGMKLSADRRWLAMQQQMIVPRNVLLPPTGEFEVAVWDFSEMKQSAAITSCSQLLDIAPDGKVVAVVRKKQLEVWDVAASKALASMPFDDTNFSAACFSPDGKFLALGAGSMLLLWHWEEKAFSANELKSQIGSLAFSPDGKFLAVGPAPGRDINVFDVKTRKVVQTLNNGTELSMNVPRLAYVQGGRVLIACDNALYEKEINVPHRIHLWDTADGSLIHQLATPAERPYNLAVSPNGRYLITMLEDDKGVSLSTWRLDGHKRAAETGPQPPAAERGR